MWESGERLHADERKVFFRMNTNMTEDETDLRMDYSSFDDPIWNTQLNNALLPGASSKVKLEKNQKRGRYLVATKNIEPGMNNIYS